MPKLERRPYPTADPLSIPLDPDGFPVLTGTAAPLRPRKTLSPVACFFCQATNGAAYVAATKTGFATFYCNSCNARVFTHTPQSHELLRRWAKIARHPAILAKLTEWLGDADAF